MYIPTYKQTVLSIAGLMLVAASIAGLSRIHGTPSSVATQSSSFRISDSRAAPVLPLKTKMMLLTDPRRRGSSGRGIWHAWDSYEDWRHAKSIENVDVTAFCRFLKHWVLWSNGPRLAASALWYLSQDEDRFAQFRARRIGSYDEQLEGAVARGMAYAVEKILARLGNFGITVEDHRSIRMHRNSDASSTPFDMPSIRTLADFRSFSVSVPGKGAPANEDLWIQRIWHAMCVIFPALEELHLLRDPHLGRDLTAGEMRGVGRCSGVKKLGMVDCAGTGTIKCLDGSAVSSSVRTLVLGRLRLRGSDLDTISGLSIHELFFHRTLTDAHRNSLARILEQEPVADSLEKLHIVFVDNTDISVRETNAIINLRNVQVLSLRAEKNGCGECVARILDGTPVSAGLRELHLALPALSRSDLDIVADMGIDLLSISCESLTGEHLARIGARVAGSLITRLEIKGGDASAILGGLAAFRGLTSLKLEQYTASARSRPDMSTVLAGNRSLKRLELVNKQLLPLLETFVHEKTDLEELVLSIDELDASELAAVLTDKSELKTLGITGGNVTGRAVSTIADLGALTGLEIRGASMSYGDLATLVGSGDLQRRMGRKFRLHVRTPPMDKNEADTLRRHGLVYKEGTITL